MKLKGINTRLTVLISALAVASMLLFSCSPREINPQLEYSTYLGSSGKDGANNWLKYFSIDQSGSVYFATSAYTDDFPVTDQAYDKTYNGGNRWGEEDLVIIEFNIEDNALKYASYLGGKNGPEFVSQVLRKGNSLYLAGNTASSDFPITTNAFDSTFNGPDFRHSDAYITRFEGNKLAYSSYIGTSGTDWAQKIFVNDKNEVTLVGLFKVFNELPNVHSFMEDEEGRQGYTGIIRLNAKGDVILSSTKLAPSWNLDACTDEDGNIYIAAQTPSENAPTTPGAYDTSFNGGDKNYGGDILITKLNPTGDKILFSTYLGGANHERAPSICLDKDNNILVFGRTQSEDFPLSADAIDKSFDGKSELFLSKLSNDGKQLLYSSYLGGNRGEINANITVSKNGDVFLCGVTSSEDFPITKNALQDTINGSGDVFITVFDPSLKTLKFSTFLGGSKTESARIKVDNDGHIIGVGYTSSPDFITTAKAYSTVLNGESDAIIFKISL
ncbi:MAG: hypothetical protein QM503_08015 [Bacteroidota bacterium]